MKKTINDLVEHVKKYNDAVIIIGSGIYTNKPVLDQFNEIYTRKNLVRNPDALWDYFISNMYKAAPIEASRICLNLNKLSEHTSLVIDQNIDTIRIKNKIDLHGSVHSFTCTKCKTLYTGEYVFSVKPYESKCELCDGTLRPTALLSGERYNQVDFTKVQEAIKSTHTIVLIGMDYTEESLMKLISEYGDIKDFKSQSDDENANMLIAIQSVDEEFDPNEMSFFEFLVKDDIGSAVSRLVEAF